MGDQPIAVGGAEGGDVQRLPERKRLQIADCVHAPDETADPLERAGIFQLGRAPGESRADAKALTAKRRLELGERAADQSDAIGMQ